ncbi:rootletin [Plutella xylostella]|uniref:rootletin n=1 Tax=Plutella xylostella TaxID=51655 RepID=UPI00203301DD|nr:rootletin [Plutella xylostella]
MLEMNKGSQGDSPLSRAGGGDISERELSRERYTLQYTPPNRVQPAHPKKQLLSAPVNKFTASRRGPAASLQRIKTCLDECRLQSTPPRRPIGPKAVSMEDLTPGKKIKMDRSDHLETVRSPLGSSVERAAAARIGRFMLAAAWRRRRREVQCLKKTLECQVSGSERLRRQVHTLRALLDSDCGKLRRALHELQRLKQLLAEKEAERLLLQREKLALEGDVCAAEDRASEMSIGWHNCRNELELARAAAAGGERALAQERAAAAEARQQRDHAYSRLSLLEGALSQHEALLAAAEAEAAALRREAEERQSALDDREERLKAEIEARERSSRECALLNLRMTTAADETRALKSLLLQLQGELARLGAELDATRERLDWWPRPLVRMLGAARSWLYNPKSIPEAVVWSLVPARHGC